MTVKEFVERMITTFDYLALFTERIASAGGHVHLVPDSAAAADTILTIVEEVQHRTLWVSGEAAQRAVTLIDRLGELGLTTRAPSCPAEVRDQPFGLAIAEAVIAETGSAIMSEPNIPSRSVTLMTETLVIVCPASLLMSSLDDAAKVLRAISADGASYATFITGPSRTADIERQLTVGVQGPGALHIILVDELT